MSTARPVYISVLLGQPRVDPERDVVFVCVSDAPVSATFDQLTRDVPVGAEVFVCLIGVDGYHPLAYTNGVPRSRVSPVKLRCGQTASFVVAAFDRGAIRVEASWPGVYDLVAAATIAAPSRNRRP